MRSAVSVVAAFGALVASGSAWSHPNDASQDRFVAAAKAADISAMEKLLISPVLRGNGAQVPAVDFLSFISKCTLTDDNVDMISWRCPPANPGDRGVVVVGAASSKGGKIELSKVLFMAAPPELPGK